MSDLISREALMEKMNRRLDDLRKKHGQYDHYTDGFDDAVDMVMDFPAAEAEPVRHGHWVKCQGKSNIWYCSECGEKINYKQNRRTYNIPKVPVWQKNKRCRRCGAKMG